MCLVSFLLKSAMLSIAFLPTASSIFLAFLSRRFSSAIANQESLSTLEVEMRKLEGVVKEVVDEMAYLQRREARMRDTNGLFLPPYHSLAPCLGLSLTQFSSIFVTPCRVDKRTRAELCAHYVGCAAGSGSLAGAFLFSGRRLHPLLPPLLAFLLTRPCDRNADLCDLIMLTQVLHLRSYFKRKYLID